ncbi:metallophosphoesterase family protein [Lysinibacillus sp. SGAir0095]|uniref:metallophosphoesterase family protein n=1 Tax=Lysinibacillus sp. SGAir0095 TaxID=2070463 RepID=UPI0010CD264B|nr:metallophosphoesterase family protein [Lysinibacillus sp. SGAir0095]QCR33421.1 serine/threonine protein phosphatase [Lysinibacillus sp. SGAir0095]
MDKVFVIGDIHGCYSLLESLLTKWNPEEEQLVFLGDYVDRGPESLRVLQKVIQLAQDYDVVTLSGNHEQLFLGWLDKPEEVSEYYFNPKVGGAATVQSFYNDPAFNIATTNFSVKEMTAKIQKEHSKIIEFVKGLRRFYLWGPFLFVHAGISSVVENFRDTKEEDFYWIREEFYNVPHKAKEIVVFGHTPTVLLNEDKSSDIWISSCQRKLGIDGGGAIFERGQLHGVVFTIGSKEITIHSVGLMTELTTKTIELDF